ncbi:MAG TPA: hypothetical protein VK186_12410 [Candidatus Deferrimicrobium sp.]|nr:hypothetical protein [Candidatus Deferrimicrobium sp.]
MTIDKIKSNKLTYLLVLMSIILLFSLPAVSQVAQTVDPVTVVTRELQVQLQLTEEQVARVVKIFKMAQSQALMDRENFKGNALALIQAALRRRDMTDGLVEGSLTPEQKPAFVEYKQKRKWTEELFYLNEGLLLSEAQSVQVKQILDEHRELLKAERENMQAWSENSAEMLNDPYGNMYGGVGGVNGMPGTVPVPGSVPGSVPGQLRQGGMRGDMPGELRGVNEESRLLETLKDQDSKKEKKIEKVLTEEQQKMYKDIIKMQQQELKKRLEERSQD